MNTQSDAHIKECQEYQAKLAYDALGDAEKKVADAKLRVRKIQMSVIRSQAAIIRETESIHHNSILLKNEIERLLVMQGLVAA